MKKNGNRMTFGRKFFIVILTSFLLWGAFVLSVYKAPSILTPYVFAILVGAQVLVGMMYVGGNVWNTFIKSKYYQPALDAKNVSNAFQAVTGSVQGG